MKRKNSRNERAEMMVGTMRLFHKVLGEILSDHDAADNPPTPPRRPPQAARIEEPKLRLVKTA